MKQLLSAGAVVAALFAAAPAALGGWFHRGGCETCGGCAAAPSQVYLKATITEQKYTETKPPALPVAGAKISFGTTDVCTKKLVEVDAVDPHTGCVTKQLKEVPVVEKAKTTTIEITPPPPGDCKPVVEERVRRNVTIVIEHRQACP